METKICTTCCKEMPIEKFRKSRYGRVSVCNECVFKKRMETKESNKAAKALNHDKEIEDARRLRLSQFTPRELMEELFRRGYEGKLKYTRVDVIDISNF